MDLTFPLMWIAYPFAALLCYIPCLNGPPLFDDLEVLENAAQYRFREWGYVRASYRTPVLASYAAQRIWPGTMRSLHIGNTLIHALAAMVAAGIASALRFGDETAFMAGLLYAVHPFAANTVAFISGRASIMSTLCGLTAVWTVLTPGMAHWAILALGLSILSKEDGIGFFPLVFLIGILQGQTALAILLASAGAAFLVWHRRQLMIYLRGNGDEVMASIGLPRSHPQPRHGYTVLVETLLHLPLWLVGQGLSPYHGSGVRVPSPARLALAWGIAAIAGALLVAAPIPALILLAGPWTVYIVCRAPDQICEYRSYASLAGMVLLIAPLVDGVWAWAAILGAAGAATAVRSSVWQSGIALWAAAARHSSGDPSRAHGELGAYFKIQGDHFRSEAALRDAIGINPRFGPALNNLAWILWHRKVTAEAAAVRYDQEEKPGSAAWERGRAEAFHRESLEIMTACTVRCPDYALGWQDLGKLYDGSNRYDEANACYQKSLTLEPRMVHAVNRLGLAAFYEKRFDEAASSFERALQLQPGHFEFVYNRAVAWKHRGDAGGAKQEFLRLPQPCPITGNMIRLEFAQ